MELVYKYTITSKSFYFCCKLHNDVCCAALKWYFSISESQATEKLQQNPKKKKKKRLQASVNKRLTAKSTWAFWISFSLNFEYIKFHIFILMWVCLCVSESPAVVRQIIFTPLLALALSQHKMDIRNAKGWMAQTVIGPCGRLCRWSCFKLSNPERRANVWSVSWKNRKGGQAANLKLNSFLFQIILPAKKTLKITSLHV